MIPVIALVGRKNVGKSTLFNRLTCTNDALVGLGDVGFTRDRRYGILKWRGYQLVITDTAGIGVLSHDDVELLVFNQSKYAILEADLILFVVDGQNGLVPYDYDVVNYFYKLKKSVFVVVNKIDNLKLKYKELEFYVLGFKTVISVSASHGYGIDVLLKEIFLNLYSRKLLLKNQSSNENFKLNFFLKTPSYFLNNINYNEDLIILAVIGNPNVGKSTFINFLLGENRVVVCDIPGTTRDSVYVSMIYNGYKFILIDTAGIRKKNIVNSFIEKFSVRQTLKVIQNATVVLLLIAADCGISNYDLSLLNHILSSGKSLVIGINKWDLLSTDHQKRFKEICSLRMRFVHYVNINFISALHGDGVFNILNLIIKAHRVSFRSISTSCLTSIMNLAVDKYQPPSAYGRKVKLKYAHMGGCNPLIIVIHGNYVTGLSNNYKCYLLNYFSHALKISNLSICIRFKESK